MTPKPVEACPPGAHGMRHDPKIPTRKRNVTATPSQSSKVATLSACKKWRPTRRPSGKRQPLAGLPFVPKEKGRGQTRQLCYGEGKPYRKPLLDREGSNGQTVAGALAGVAQRSETVPAENQDFFKKVLDNSGCLCYNKDTSRGKRGRPRRGGDTSPSKTT